MAMFDDVSTFEQGLRRMFDKRERNRNMDKFTHSS